MIEPSDIERAELPETSARYIEDLEADIERKDELIEEAAILLDKCDAKIERKDEAIIKAKLLIKKYNRWTGQATVQDHVPDHSARIAVSWLDQALQNKEVSDANQHLHPVRNTGIHG